MSQVDNLLSLCWLGLHWWGRWDEPYTAKVMSFPNDDGQPVEHLAYRQDRRCIACGRVQKRKIEIKNG